MSDKLLPCPFCGCETISNFAIRDGRAVGCTSCGVSMGGYSPDALGKAIAKWNTRAPALAGCVIPDETRRHRLIRPIIGIENRTAQEVFDIMADRIRQALEKDSQ